LSAVELVPALVGGACLAMSGVRLWARRTRGYVRLVIEPYRSDRVVPGALVSTLAAIHALVSVRGPRRVLTGQPSVALEIHHDVRSGGAPLAWFAICVPAGREAEVTAALRSAYPNCRVRRVTGWEAPSGAILRLHKRRAFTEPVRRVADVDPDRPPVERLLRAMGAAGGSTAVQIALTPAPLALGRLAGRVAGHRRSEDETGSLESDESRVVGSFFWADLRLIGQRSAQLTPVAAELRAAGHAPNRLVGRRARGRRRTWATRVGRGEANPVPGVGRAAYAAEELASIWQLPSPGFAAVPLVRCSTPLAPAPAGVRRARPGSGLLADGHGPVTIHPDLRRQNTAVVGTVEQGKTSYLVASVREDLRREDCAVVVLDPKGDAADAALSVVPDRRVCTLLDMARPTCGFNPLAVDAPVDAIADYVVASLRQLFADGEVRGSSDRYLRNAVIGALAFDRRSSLWDVGRLLEVGAEGTAVRARVADRLAGLPEYAEVAAFLADELPVQLRDARATTTAKLDAPANKLARVLNSTSVKRVLLNESLRIDFDGLIERREVLIVRGALGELGAGNVSVLMQLLLGMLDAALGRAQDRRPSGRRTAVALKVDEAPLVINESFAQTMALKRSAGLETVACWQTDAQWPAELRDQLDALFAHRVLFATASAIDARAAAGLLMAEFADQLRAGDQTVATLAAPDVRLHLPRHTAVVSWSTPAGRDRPFIGRTIPLTVDPARIARIAERQRDRGGREVEDLSPRRRLVDPRAPELALGRVAPSAGDSLPVATPDIAADRPSSGSAGPAAAGRTRAPAAGGQAGGAVAGGRSGSGVAGGRSGGAVAGVQPRGAVAGGRSGGGGAGGQPRGVGAGGQAGGGVVGGRSGGVGAGGRSGTCAAGQSGGAAAGGLTGGTTDGAGVWPEESADVPAGYVQQPPNAPKSPPTARAQSPAGTRDSRDSEPAATFAELEAVDAATSVRWLPVAPPTTRPRLDPRELELLSWIAAARCALSSQAHRRTSPGQSLTTTQRRLKRLADAGLVARFQLHGGDGGGVPFCCAATAPALELLELTGRRAPPLGDATLDSLRTDLHTVGWVLALEACAPADVVSVLGPGRARVAPPTGSGLADLPLDPGVHARDFVAGAADPAGRRPVESFVGISPAAAVEVRIHAGTARSDAEPHETPAAPPATTDLLVFHAPSDTTRLVGLLERCDHLLAGWWRLVPRYARLGRPPAVVILSRDSASAARLAELADPILVACLARIGEPPDRWLYPGRSGIVFASESDLHDRQLDGWGAADLPPTVRRRVTGLESDAPLARGSDSPAGIRRGPIVGLAGAGERPPTGGPARPPAPWR
jgi:hypothetical protein